MKCGWQRAKLGIVGGTLGLCVAAALVRPMPSRRAPAPRPHELYRVVVQELAARRVADYAGAYRHVSLSMQERFNFDDYVAFVRTDHPELARFERVEFGAIATSRRHVLVPAYFFLPGGGIALVHYTLVREEGAWKIDSSRVEKRWGRDHRVGGERT
jgi:hypothetical protein